MEIDRLQPEDLGALGELFRQFWGESSSLDKMGATFARLAANPAYHLVAARQDGRLVGFAMGIVCEELYGECRPFMVVEDVVDDRGLRREGAGSALMRELEAIARATDCCQIIFVTEADRTGAQRFYQSLGYAHEPYRGFKKRII